MVRSLWAYGLAGLATAVMATSSTTACCSAILGLLAPSESCCHQADADEEPRATECECCTADNGQPFVSIANTAPGAPLIALLAFASAPTPVLSRPVSSTAFRWWEARPPPLLHRTVLLLI